MDASLGNSNPDRELDEVDLERLSAGAVAPLAAVLLAPSSGSFAIDLGLVALSRTDSQNASDPAASATRPRG